MIPLDISTEFQVVEYCGTTLWFHEFQYDKATRRRETENFVSWGMLYSTEH